MEKGFRQMLAERQKEVNSLVCVGLDPLLEKMPKRYEAFTLKEAALFSWMKAIVDATAPFACMFKPQSAHWEAIERGRDTLQLVIRHIKEQYPDIPIFLDCKRGDIGRTQQCYRVAHLEIDGVHGMNFSPYMGKDCMEGLVDKNNPGKALVGLCYTSNPAAREIQDLQIYIGGEILATQLWKVMAEKILKWAEDLGIVADAGLVMAAAYENPKGSGKIYSDHLTFCRDIVGDKLWFLIPGIGTQGGYIAETVKAAFTGPGSIAINSSSDIIFASKGEDFAEAAAKKAEQLRDQIREAGGNC